MLPTPASAISRDPAARRGRGASTHARASLVDPLIADTLALRRRLARCGRTSAAELGGPAAALFAVFADQLRASADLMRECVRGAGGARRTQRADVAPRGSAPADEGAYASPGDAVRQLLADEDQVARRLRDAIAACDDRADERTADRLEEVLDEIERQRWFLTDLLRRRDAAAARAPAS